jgi:putative ABC transport system permease protein
MWRFLNDLVFRTRAIFRRHAADRDLHDEFAHHRTMLVAELRDAGSSAEDAERRANVHMGSMAAESELARDGWGVSPVNEFLADVRFALRQMRRHPGFSAIAILTVGLGIGATVALASVAHAVILRALPYADESRIHVFWSSFGWGGDEYAQGKSDESSRLITGGVALLGLLLHA